jgi:GTP-binding protein
MVDGVVLLVDASEGPLPQTRFVLRKALEAKLPVILLVNKTDRPDARIAEVEEEAHDLLLGLAGDLVDDVPDLDVDALLDVPVVYASGAPAPRLATGPPTASCPTTTTSSRCSRRSSSTSRSVRRRGAAAGVGHQPRLVAVPRPSRAAARLQRHAEEGQTVAWVRHDGSHSNARITELLKTRRSSATRPSRRPRRHRRHRRHRGHHDRRDDRRSRGRAAAAGHHGRRPGHLDDDRHEHLAAHGQGQGHKLTARMVKDRLDRELIGNVSLKVVDIGRPDAWEVQGRGELALAILVENMRREGFELTVGKPQVVTKRGEDGKVKEPFEHLTIDAPEEHLGAITQLMAARKGRMDTMTNHGTGWVRMEFVVPSRGLIGFRSEFLTITRGTGIANAISHGYDDWAGQITTRQNGSIVADRSGVVTRSR